MDGKANVMVQESCKKNIQMLNVLHSAHLSPAAPGRTNTKQFLFFCTWEKMCMGFSGDLAQHIQAAVAGPCGQHGKRVTSSAGFVCSQQSCPVLSCWLGTSWHVPVQTCGLSQRLHCSHHLLSSGQLSSSSGSPQWSWLRNLKRHCMLLWHSGAGNQLMVTSVKLQISD